MTTGIHTWQAFNGLLMAQADPHYPTRIWGYSQPREIALPANGGAFGYVLEGKLEMKAEGYSAQLAAGHWFADSQSSRLRILENSRVLVVQRLGFRGLNVRGGPLERAGRLRYVDGCSDTLLCAPPLLGDPCLNHLHFPRHVNQTMHMHPSVRVGAVARGQGICRLRNSEIPLRAGSIFCIPANVEHAFATTAETMDVVAYHPDSDWGPTHEAHPMINRTWIGQNIPIDNRSPQHAAMELVHGEVASDK